MAEFAWTVPCLVAEDGELIAGHGRVLAATQLRLTADAGAFLALSADPIVLKSAAATST
jgi:ParB-like chromosome segregation protein Spo0J